MDIDEFKNKLAEYDKKDIVITDHAELQAMVRGIEIEEVKNNITNPEKLVYVQEQDAAKAREKKYDCYFAYSDKLSHRYIMVVNGKIIIVTIIKINRDWQKIIEGKK